MFTTGMHGPEQPHRMKPGSHAGSQESMCRSKLGHRLSAASCCILCTEKERGYVQLAVLYVAVPITPCSSVGMHDPDQSRQMKPGSYEEARSRCIWRL